MKKIIAIALALVMVFALCACGSTSSSAPADSSASASSGEKVVKIGVFEPTSGDSASGGKKEVLGMQYANAETPTVDINGETYKVELVLADDGSSTDKAPSAASELVSKGVSIVLGSYGSGVSMAGGPKFEEAGLAAMGVTCTNPNVTAGNDYYFRVCFLDPFQGSVMASFAMEEFGAKKAYVLSMLGDDYTVGLAKNFVIAFEAAGGEIVADETFVEGTADFSAYLNNAVAGGADVIFAPSAIAYAPQIIEQASALGISLPILGGDTYIGDHCIIGGNTWLTHSVAPGSTVSNDGRVYKARCKAGEQCQDCPAKC